MTTMYGGTSANGVPFMSSGDGMGTGALLIVLTLNSFLS